MSDVCRGCNVPYHECSEEYDWEEVEAFDEKDGYWYYMCLKCGEEAFFDEDEDNYGNLYCNHCGCATNMYGGLQETGYPLGHNQPYYQNAKKEMSE